MEFDCELNQHNYNKRKNLMKIHTAVITGLALMISGCVTTSPGSDKSSPGSEGKCSEGNLRFHVGDSYLWVTPRSKCAAPGETIEAEIVSHGNYVVEESEVRIEGAVAWLDKDNSPDKFRISITVDPRAEVNRDYKYELIVTGVGRLDPVVRVKTQGL